jgi:hypothetical protein
MNLVQGFFFFFSHGSLLIFEITSIKSDYYLKRSFKMIEMFYNDKIDLFMQTKRKLIDY